MRVQVDAERCIGAGQCVLIAPEVFDQSDEGTVTVLTQSPDESILGVVREAVRACPSRSVSLADG